MSPFAATLGTCTRGVGVNILASLREISGAAVGSYLDPGLGHQECTVVHFRHRQDVLRFGQADPCRHSRLAAPRHKLKASNLNERVARREHADMTHVVRLSHWAIDIERERYGIA